jgi:hypothetical protein
MLGLLQRCSEATLAGEEANECNALAATVWSEIAQNAAGVSVPRSAEPPTGPIV